MMKALSTISFGFAPTGSRVSRLFVEGLGAYLERDFRGAAEQYKAALGVCPEDQPAAVLLERCRGFLSAPPPEDWNGVYVATEK